MGESPFLTRKPVVLMLTLCVGLVAATALIAFGPGQSALHAAREDIEKSSKRLARFEQKRESTNAIAPEQRDAWERHYEELSRFGAPDRDEAGLVAWVASALEESTVKGLEVLPGRPTRMDADAEEGASGLELRAPFGDEGVLLRTVPLRVRFEARYSDMARILRRIESRGSAFRITRLQVTRGFPGVRVDLDLDLFVREVLDS